MRKLLLILICFFRFDALPGQPPSFVFTHLGEKNGLSNNFVNCLLKDKRGLIWIGTLDGLNAFDGSHFLTFKNRRDSGSIGNNTVHAVCEDPAGMIWGGTDNGIFRFNPLTGIFKNYSIPNNRAGNNIFNIICDKDGDIWAAGYWFVFRLDKQKDVFTETAKLAEDPAAADQYNIRKKGMLADESGKGFWLATRSGIVFYDKQNNRFLNDKNQPGLALFSKRNVSALAAGSGGNCWFFDNDKKELVCFNPQSKQLVQQINIAAVMPGASGAALFESSDKKLWFSSWTYELLVVDLAGNNRLLPLQHDDKNELSVAAAFFWGILEDEDHTIWLGTSGGISKCNTRQALYRSYRLPYFKTTALPNERIVSFNESPYDKSWWIGTTAKKIIQYFPGNGEYHVFDLNKAERNANGELPAFFYKIRFYFNRVIICAYNGLWEYAKEDARIRPFRLLPEILQKARVKDIAAFSDSLYYLTAGELLYSWNPPTGNITTTGFSDPVFKSIENPSFSFANSNPGETLWTSIGLGWVGAWDNHTLQPVQLYKNTAQEQNGFISDFTTDKQGDVWFAVTGSGLYVYQKQKKEIKRWTSADGLVNNHIQTTVCDKDGQIWCAAYNKLSVFVPAAGGFYNFSLPVSENNLNYNNWGIRLSNGHILISMMNDLVEFDPEKLAIQPVIRKPIISSLLIDGKERFTAGLSSLQLEPHENSLQIRFGLPGDKETFPYALRYRLGGFDNNWTEAKESNEAVYSHLPPGRYTFRLMAFARNNAWQPEEIILVIHIRTPFYKSTWFYALCAVLLMTGLILFYRMRMRHQRRILTLETKTASLEKEKTIVQYESLKQQLNPHFLFNSLTSLRSLIKTDARTAAGFLDGMSKVYRYVLRSGDHELVRLQEELEFVKTYAELQQIRFKEGLIVNIRTDEDCSGKYIVPVTLQNLLENAIKHNTADRESPLQVDIYNEGDCMVVKNNLQRYRMVETSNKKGLSNLKTLYRYYTDIPLECTEDNRFFIVKIPLL